MNNKPCVLPSLKAPIQFQDTRVKFSSVSPVSNHACEREPRGVINVKQQEVLAKRKYLIPLPRMRVSIALDMS